MPETTPSLTPQEIRDMWSAVKSGELTTDDVQKLMYKVDAKTQGAIRKTSPVPLKSSFLGTEDFTGRMREFAKPVLKEMGENLAAPMLHPLKTVAGVASAVAHPIDAASSLVNTGKEALSGDPKAIGDVLSAVAAPKIYGSVRSGVGKLGTTLATSEKAQNAVNAVGGTALGYTGMGALTGGRGGFVGGMMGRNLLKDSTIPKRIGLALQRLSGETPPSTPSNVPANATGTAFTTQRPMVPNAVFRQGAAETTSGSVLSPDELAWMKKQGFNPDGVVKVEQAIRAEEAKASAPPNSVQTAPPPPPKSVAPPTPGAATSIGTTPPVASAPLQTYEALGIDRAQWMKMSGPEKMAAVQRGKVSASSTPPVAESTPTATPKPSVRATRVKTPSTKDAKFAEGNTGGDALASIQRDAYGKVSETAPNGANAPGLMKKGPTLPADVPIPEPLKAYPEAAQEFVRMVKAGKSPEEALTLLIRQLAQTQRLGTPMTGTVQDAVTARNAKGRWPG